jgi:hypothetical protein
MIGDTGSQPRMVLDKLEGGSCSVELLPNEDRYHKVRKREQQSNGASVSRTRLLIAESAQYKQRSN